MDEMPDQRVTRPLSVAEAGQLANQFAAQNRFADHQDRVAIDTTKNDRQNLKTFARYLHDAGVTEERDWLGDPAAWRDVTWGLVEGFVRWQLAQGYAVNSVNRRLTTVKRYAGLAFMAGFLAQDAHLRIQQVRGYRQSEGRHVDERREQTRIGDKKAQATRLTDAQAAALIQQPPTPQGRRDALLLALLIFLGLRIGEVWRLKEENFALEQGMLTFYRRKVDKVQTHHLLEALPAAAVYFSQRKRPENILWYRTDKRGQAIMQPMSLRALQMRVTELGERIGIAQLSPHDLRHHWATVTASRTDLKTFQQAGGWTSLAMPIRYINDNEIANDALKKSRQQSA